MHLYPLTFLIPPFYGMGISFVSYTSDKIKYYSALLKRGITIRIDSRE